MKTNPFSLFHDLRARGEKDVFKRTQSRLTIGYSWQIMLFLVLFIIVVFAVLYIVIFKNQEHQVQSMVEQEAKVIENYMTQNDQSLQDGKNQEVVLAGVEQFFYYVIDPRGEMLLGDEDIPQFRSELLSSIQRRTPEENKIYQERLQINLSNIDHIRREKSEHEIQLTPTQSDIRLMIASEPDYV